MLRRLWLWFRGPVPGFLDGRLVVRLRDFANARALRRALSDPEFDCRVDRVSSACERAATAARMQHGRGFELAAAGRGRQFLVREAGGGAR